MHCKLLWSGCLQQQVNLMDYITFCVSFLFVFFATFDCDMQISMSAKIMITMLWLQGPWCPENLWSLIKGAKSAFKVCRSSSSHLLGISAPLRPRSLPNPKAIWMSFTISRLPKFARSYDNVSYRIFNWRDNVMWLMIIQIADRIKSNSHT